MCGRDFWSGQGFEASWIISRRLSSLPLKLPMSRDGESSRDSFTCQKAYVDLVNVCLRLEPGESKNAEGRQFPLTAELRAVLEQQLSRTRELEKATGQVIPWLFHRDVKPIKSLRRAWRTACKLAG